MAKRLTSEQDAFGHAVWDHYHGTNAFEIIERSDGHFAISSGTFDTILMLGNNFGLFANPIKARRLLRRFKSLTSSGATLIVESLNVYDTKDPDHLAYLAANRERGRMSGQIRIRARYKRFVTPWFDYLMVSLAEMETLLEGTGWRVAKRYEHAGARFYTAIIERID